ncbi:hypothetical protein BDZ94DRAFT_1214844 [Collybia nuda]|uniref:BTB domain-containing protein n=1 Tax=Collybia nuda TaxID=64659 RepID=A0A9P5Y9U3_9AGAR|nr:hypothetical protein BDZ94DRAFT_1214844 [Collybia nuda]
MTTISTQGPTTHNDGDEEMNTIQLTGSSCIRDTTYYKEEGDCTIFVKTTLFKIHRFILARDGSTFEGMFALPPGNCPTQGSSDDNPVVLHDEPDDFRAMCWALYALPMDISTPQLSTESDVSKFLGISRLANKYHFASFEKWSTSALSQKCTAEATSFLLSCSRDMFVQIFDVAVLCRLSRLTATIANICIRRTKIGDLGIGQALLLGEKHGLRDLQGKLYYNHLLAMDAHDTKPIPNGTAYIYDNSTLNPTQMLRLYAGYWSLSQYWQNICNMPTPQLPMVNGCTNTFHSEYCDTEWPDMWEGAISSVHERRLFGVNVTGNLDLLKIDLALQQPRKQNASASCLAAAGEFVSALKRDLEKTLPEHFLGAENT